MKTVTYPVVTVEEFRKLLMDALLHEHKDWSQEELFNWLLDHGFAKFDIQNLGEVLRSMRGYIYCLNPVLVDFGDNTFYWMVYGMDAILVKKP